MVLKSKLSCNDGWRNQSHLKLVCDKLLSRSIHLTMCVIKIAFQISNEKNILNMMIKYGWTLDMDQKIVKSCLLHLHYDRSMLILLSSSYTTFHSPEFHKNVFIYCPLIIVL